MRQFLYLIGIAAFGLSGCHHATKPVQLRPGAEAVKVAKSDPTDNFAEVGPVSGFSGRGCGGFGHMGSYEDAVTDLKNRANAMGADYVQIMTITEPHSEPNCYDNRYKISGTAYKQTRASPSPVPIVETSDQSKIVKRLRELQSLRDDGVITQKEFEQLKARALKE